MNRPKVRTLVFLVLLILAVGVLAFAAANRHSPGNKGNPAPALAQAQGSDSGGIRSANPAASGSEELPPLPQQAPAPGAAKRLPRSYENAPPQIPHSVAGLLPITLKQNACLNCHLPQVAKSIGATPIPPSHLKIDLFDKSDLKRTSVDAARFNCVLCHVPQANVKLPVANTFQADFRNPSLLTSSDLFDKWDEGVK